MKNQLLAALLLFGFLGTPVWGQTPEKEQVDAQKEKRMEWFANAKLGIFIHWGIYSVKGVSESWSFFNKYLPYEEYMSQKDGFTASKYNPKAWVNLIKESVGHVIPLLRPSITMVWLYGIQKRES